ncbi:MAG: hypothetical protein KF837_35785 [Labilithrix sp.]|nr:hypothetical protein [Labilithrix sp.]
MLSLSRISLVAALAVLVCCKRTEGGKATPAVSASASASAAPATTPPTTELETVKDPVEDAFTLGMPKGWQNRAYSARVFDVHSMVATAISPDGSVLLYFGDPGLPQYWSPAHATPVHREMQRFNPRMKIEPFVRATTYFPDYVKKKFGALPGFALEETAPDAEAEARSAQQFVEAGVKMVPTAARVAFRYTDQGKPMRGLVLGSTVDSGPFWIATVSGIAAAGDPKPYLPMLDAMSRTHRMNPAWQAEQARKHQAQMAQIDAFGRQLQAQHQQNMAALQASAQRHQARMSAIHAQADANMAAYNARMASSDAQHRAFLNYINEERTVVDASGKTYQVDGSYDRYFFNKNNHTYVGGDTTTDLEKLRALGLNPNDYEEVKIER